MVKSDVLATKDTGDESRHVRFLNRIQMSVLNKPKLERIKKRFVGRVDLLGMIEEGFQRGISLSRI